MNTVALDKEIVRGAVNHVAFYEAHLGPGKQNGGGEIKYQCPFHTDGKHPNWSVDPATGLGFCQVCGIGGDVFWFVERHKQIEFPEAVKYVAGWSGTSSTTPAKTVKTSKKERSHLLDDPAAMDRHVQASGDTLWADGEVADTLRTQRVLTPTAMLEARIGWDDFARRYVIPLIDARNPAGKIEGLKFYTPDPADGEAKMYGLTGQQLKGVLYGKIGTPESRLWIAEGELDALALIAAGESAVTVCTGAGEKDPLGGWNDEFSPELKDRDVIACGDHDAPGKAYTGGIVRSALSAGARSVQMVAWPADRPDKHDVTDELRQRGIEGLVRLLVAADSPVPDCAVEDGVDDVPATPRVRTKIIFRAELVAVTDEAEVALIDAGDSGIYSRANRLVHFVRATGEGTDADLIIPAKGTPEICMATKTWVREAIDRCAIFVKPTDDGDKKVLPPTWAAETILERGGRKFPRLIAVIETPTMRSTGSILTDPGYDPKTQLLYIPGADFPAVPDKPSDLDLGVAIDTINDVLIDFPYQTDEDRAAHVATILTAVGRYAIKGPVPMSAFRSPTPGTGKGLAASVVSLIATGREPASMAPTDSNEEWRKAIMSIGIAGWPVVLIDNVAGMLKSPVLDSILTKIEHTDRLLGVSEMKQVPMIATWMVTGNNISFGGDLPRRILAIDMDASVEFPEDRQDFRHPELRKYVTENRGELVAAALTILRGYHVAGRPAHGKPRKGSFEAWDDLIRGAVVWATKKDPIATSERVRSESNADGETLGVLLKVLAREMVDEPKTAAQIIALAENNLEIASAIKAGTSRGQLDSRSLGYLLKKFQKRISGGLSIYQAGHDRNSSVLWSIGKANR